ncbi:MAG TPA: MMPL family transporter, partial [Lacipirellulaceae bacterium]|nr:MMPL family transporter [Lacipirellulaceae bacterium]
SAEANRARWYARVVTGPQVIRHLMQSQVGLSYAAAIKRLEGALVGPPGRDAQGRTLGNDTRTTCMVVYLSSEAMASTPAMRAAIEAIPQIAAAQCGIDPASMHLGGPPVDQVTIDAEGRRTLVRLAALAGIISVAACYWRLGSVRLTALVVAVGATSAGLSLALVFYFGVFEVLGLGRAAPQWGTLDAVLMAMPAIVYLLAMSAALHLVNYYLEARRQTGLAPAGGAAEASVGMAWRPAAIAAIATAASLAALVASDIVPVQKFGLFTALALVAMLAVLFGIMPVLLHRYPLGGPAVQRRTARLAASRLAAAPRGLVHFVIQHSTGALAFWSLALVLLGVGMTRLGASVQVLNLLDRDTRLIQDYAWLERNIGNLVPMEVVLTMPPERLRTGEEHAEADGQQYRLTMLERVELLRQVERRLESFPQISRALSAATFVPAASEGALSGASRGADYAKNKALEVHRDRLLDSDYLRMERIGGTDRPTGRELWRLNARVAALTADDAPVDYGALIGQLRRAVEPVLWSYQQRDMVVRALHEQGKRLAGARVCVLFRAPNAAAAPTADLQEHALAELLTLSGTAPRGVTYFNLAVFQRPGTGDAARDEQYRQNAIKSLRQQDAVILASASSDPVARQLVASGVYVVNATDLPAAAESTNAPLTDDGGPRPIRAVFTGTGPVVERTQRQLLGSLTQALWLSAGLVAMVVTVGFMNAPAGLLALAPSLFPLTLVFGAMGWLGMKVDLGIAMTAAVALGLAVEGTMHFAAWFRRAQAAGLDRRAAARRAYDQCGGPMIESALIAALGLGTLAFSAFTPIREFGALMVAMLGASLVGNLLLLPAILGSPLGWCFAPAPVRRLDPLRPKLAAWYEARFGRRHAGADHAHGEPEGRAPHDRRDGAELLPLPHSPGSPHFADEPAPARRAVLGYTGDDRRDMAEGPHSALHAKLQSLRRPRTGDSAAS